MPRERTIYRNPVPGTLMKQPLGCVDLDQATLDPDKLVGSRCQLAYLAARKPSGNDDAERFRCENLRAENGRCIKAMFLYPRKWTKDRKGKLYFHFHQGIDLGKLDPRAPEAKGRSNAGGLEIKSVTDGIVVHTHEWDGKKAGYGTVIGIWNRKLGLLFWYAHCQAKSLRFDEGQEVLEGETIALVGNTGDAGSPHLHFEVIDSASVAGRPRHKEVRGGPEWERELGNPRTPRLDPLEVLESLGPWGAREVFDLSNRIVTPKVAEVLHRDVEHSFGGYFPLGVNNFWHGGVHLPMPSGSVVHAPFDASIVAARLAPDEDSGMRKFGHTSFILLRHEVSERVFEAMQRGPGALPPPPPPAPEARGPIGDGLPVRDPDAVNQVKAKLHALELYLPEDPTKLTDGDVDAELGAAIKKFQQTLKNPFKRQPERWPDGVIDVPGYTWNHLVGPEAPEPVAPDDPSKPAPPPTDAKRTLYCLLMHLQPMTLKAAKAKGIEWVTRATLSVTSDDELPAEDEEDRKEADSHRIGADVRLGSTNTADIEWVERRLIRFKILTDRTSATGVADAALEAAITAFQQKHAFPKKPQFWDGVVEKGKGTDRTLQKTAFELALDKRGGGQTPKTSVDDALAKAFAKLDADEVSEIVSGLDVRVSGGEPLWLSGQAKGFDQLGKGTLKEEVHWEIFSEELLLPTWNLINDTDDDLTADVPGTIMDVFDFVRDERVSAFAILAFYRSEAAQELRRTACRFRSEWGLDMQAALRNIEARGFSTKAPKAAGKEDEEEGLEQAIAPYQWWDRASDVLPPGVTHVWHYNPIELLRVYQEILERLKPPPPPEPKDPAIHGDLSVRVLAANGMRPKQDVVVSAVRTGQGAVGRKIDDGGIATFHGLEVGTYELVVTLAGDAKSVVSPKSTIITPFGRTEVSIQTQLEGRPVPHGDLTVAVRRLIGGPAEGAQLTIKGAGLEPDRDPVVRVGGKSVVFAKLPAGEYQLEAIYSNPRNPAHPNDEVRVEKTVAFDGKSKKVTMHVPRGRCDIRVTADDGGMPMPVGLFDEQGRPVQMFVTDGAGRASFTVEQGKYKITFGKKKKSINARFPELDVAFD